MKALLVILTVSFSVTAFADDDIYDTSSFEYNDYKTQTSSDTSSFSEVSKTAVPAKETYQNETVEIGTAATSNTADLNEQELAELGVSQNEIAQRTTASGEPLSVAQNPETEKSFQIKLRRSRK
jgi:hypothetical protein